MTRTVLAVGDVTNPRCWSGTPFYFWKSAQTQGFVTHPGQLPLEWAKWPRRKWAIQRLLTGRKPRGFQYSEAFLDRAESFIPAELWSGDILSFQHGFPRARRVKSHGGTISYYLDASFASLSQGRGLDLQLPSDIVAKTRADEYENFQLADRIVTMAHWAADDLIKEYDLPQSKIFTVLPGANIDLPEGWTPPVKPGRMGRERPFVLGFVGADWLRKGLPVVIQIRDTLANRGWNAIVRVAGNAPSKLAARPGVEFAGFLDKRDGTGKFIDFLSGCDLGCLFSEREALGISTLEFLRVGVPVTGYAIEGPADTLPADAGFRFLPTMPISEIVDRLDRYLNDADEQKRFTENAWQYSPLVTWDRCVRELNGLWQNNRVEQPFRVNTV